MSSTALVERTQRTFDFENPRQRTCEFERVPWVTKTFQVMFRSAQFPYRGLKKKKDTSSTSALRELTMEKPLYQRYDHHKVKLRNLVSMSVRKKIQIDYEASDACKAPNLAQCARGRAS